MWARNITDGFEASVGLGGLWRPKPFRDKVGLSNEGWVGQGLEG